MCRASRPASRGPSAAGGDRARFARAAAPCSSPQGSGGDSERSARSADGARSPRRPRDPGRDARSRDDEFRSPLRLRPRLPSWIDTFFFALTRFRARFAIFFAFALSRTSAASPSIGAESPRDSRLTSPSLSDVAMPGLRDRGRGPPPRGAPPSPAKSPRSSRPASVPSVRGSNASATSVSIMPIGASLVFGGRG